MNHSPAQNSVAVTGDFDDLRSSHIRLLEEAAKVGQVTVLLSSDEAIQEQTGRAPKFSFAERLYLVQAVRFVTEVIPLPTEAGLDLPEAIAGFKPSVWVDMEGAANERRADLCRQRGVKYVLFSPQQLAGFPEQPLQRPASARKKVVVTGCYDWLHSGHVRFFEEVSAHGDLYVIVGHDANIRLLKGPGHPLLPQQERRYLTGAIRYVTHSLISSGDGWLDADPEIRMLKPDIYAVNEDGDKGGKGEYCAKMGIEYLVLKRFPAPGLPARSSTNLRGF